MEKMAWFSEFMAVAFSIVYSGLVIAAQANTVPKIDISVAHENKDEIRPGESFWYAFNLTHNAASNADAKDIQVTWHIPHYIRFGQVFGGPNDVQVEARSDLIIFKKASLVVGDVANVRFQVSLDNSSEVTLGHHYAVTMTGLLWHSSASVKYTSPLSAYSMEFVVPGCSNALGMGSGEIKSHQLLASSSLPSSRPDMARFNQDAWCAQQQDANQFIKVLFAKKVKITRIVTKSRSLKAHWVKEYTIRFSDDNINWIPYKENGFEKVFKGNSDLNSPVGHWLLYPISANYIRIHPKSWNTQICMRFELYGCQISQTDNCIDPIGMEKGLIPDGALSDSVGSSYDVLTNARLNKKVKDYPFGWAPLSKDLSKKDWIQADLGSVHKITSTAIQGSNNEPVSIFFVKSYELKFSNNSIDWISGNKSDTEKLFRGPQSGEAAKFPTPAFFPKPVYARFVRLIPEEFNSMKGLRMEIYGCSSEARPTVSRAELPAEFSRRSILLDKETNTFYVCIYQENRDATSCRMTKDGKTWKDLNSLVVNLLGYDSVSKTLYGLDHHMSYMYTEDGGKIWKFISKKEWERHQMEGTVTLSTKLNDILVGKTPNLNWTASIGHTWGVSGEGIHMKEVGSVWSLVASWKCCGL